MSEILRKNESITEKIQNIELIKMKIEDIPQIAEIFISYWGTMCLYSDYEFERIISQNISYVYKINDEVIAFCLMEYIFEEDEVNIDLLCVKKEFKGNHLGEKLLSFCINYCLELECSNFTLQVSTKNVPALNLYRKLGFVVSGFLKNYYDDEAPGERDAYSMVLNI